MQDNRQIYRKVDHFKRYRIYYGLTKSFDHDAKEAGRITAVRTFGIP